MANRDTGSGELPGDVAYSAAREAIRARREMLEGAAARSPSRRRLLRAGAALAASGPLGALAQRANDDASWPARPLRLVIPYPPGGAGDVVGRLVAPPFAAALGQPVVVDNKGGGAQVIATQIVANAAPDGYTLLLATVTHAINPGLHHKLPYDSIADFTPISGVASSDLLIVAHPALGVTTVGQLVAKAKGSPGAIDFGSAGLGSGGHLAIELLKNVAGIDLTHVPYSGAGPALKDLLSGTVQLVCTSPLAAMPFVKEGRLRALAVTSARRSTLWPELPTVAEAGFPGYRATLWYVLLGPAKLPAAIVARANDAAGKVLGAPALADKFRGLGAETMHNTPAALDAFIREEVDRWTKVIETAKIART